MLMDVFVLFTSGLGALFEKITALMQYSVCFIMEG
jgi:hypothetical protein